MQQRVMTFWEHFNELFNRLKIIFYSVIILSLIVMLIPLDIKYLFDLNNSSAYPTIVTFIVRLLEDNFLPSGSELLAISWFSSLEVYVWISIVTGIVLSTPIIGFEFYKFIIPALKDEEKKFVKPFIIAFVTLFLFGVAIAYFLVVPVTFKVLAMMSSLMNVKPSYEFAQFFYMIGQGLLISGFLMTSPIYLFIVVRTGILSVETFKQNRKYLYGGILIMISILDPDPGLVTEAFLGIPLIICLEIALRLGNHYRLRNK